MAEAAPIRYGGVECNGTASPHGGAGSAVWRMRGPIKGQLVTTAPTLLCNTGSILRPGLSLSPNLAMYFLHGTVGKSSAVSGWGVQTASGGQAIALTRGGR